MGFERCHPAVKLLFFTAVLALTLVCRHWVYLLLSLGASFWYGLRLHGRRAAVFGGVLLMLAALYGVFYGSYHHFGETVLWTNGIGNPVTLEALQKGWAVGLSLAAALQWGSCLLALVTSDQVIYLIGRLWPGGAMALAALLRLIPRTKAQARKIRVARQGIGRGPGQGNLLRRVRSGAALCSMVVTWIIDALAAVSVSAGNRGGGLAHRTAFALYRMDTRDRVFLASLAACLTAALTGAALDQMWVQFDPRLAMHPMTGGAIFFAAAFGLFCLLPPLLDGYTDLRFRRARRNL